MAVWLRRQGGDAGLWFSARKTVCRKGLQPIVQLVRWQLLEYRDVPDARMA